MKIAATITAALCLLSVSAQAEQRPAFVGHYVAKCEQGLQCWLWVDKHPKAAGVYLVTFTVSRWNEFSDVKCGYSQFVRDTQDGRLVAGTDVKTVLEIGDEGRGNLTVSGIPAERCGGLLSGSYSIVERQ